MFTPFRFVLTLAITLVIVFSWLQFKEYLPSPPASESRLEQDGRLHVFFSPDCPHCHDAIEFLKAQPHVDYVLHDVSQSATDDLLDRIAKRYGYTEIGVPLFVYGSHHLMGFDSAETTGRELLKLMSDKADAEKDVRH
jgi:glutaredoxin